MNVKKECIGINPVGEKDNMCVLQIEKTAYLQFYDVIPAKGLYTLAGWINADKDGKLPILIDDSKIIKEFNIKKGWNRIISVFDTAHGGSLSLCLSKGIYYIYHIQVNAGDRICRYNGMSIVKSLVFGICDNNMECCINNESDDPIGIICKMMFKGWVNTPKIYIIETGMYIEIAGVYRPNEIIEIDTRHGHKSVKAIYHNKIRNIIDAMSITSSWLTLNKGVNHVGHTAVSGSEHILTDIIYAHEYQGV